MPQKPVDDRHVRYWIQGVEIISGCRVTAGPMVFAAAWGLAAADALVERLKGDGWIGVRRVFWYERMP